MKSAKAPSKQSPGEGALSSVRKMAVGAALLISGMTLILVWWADVATLFRGAAGIALALAGMLVLYRVR